jgi:hypothetical protein
MGRKRLLVIALLVVMFCTTAFAQFSGTVQGTVSDPGGGVISGATVTLHSASNGSDLHYVTPSTGSYFFPSIAPGAYQLKVSAQGFSQSTLDVQVGTNEVRGVNVQLHVGGADTQVIVTADVGGVNPEETRVQSTLTSEELTVLPLPNRDTSMLVQLAPGVGGFVDPSNGIGYGSSIFGNGAYQPGANAAISSPITANGLPGASNLYLIDDLPVMSTSSRGSVTILPNPDMVAQVSLQTQTYSVENGQSSSLQTSFTTKSGANKFHGSADFTYTGRFLSASKVFAPSNFNFHRQNLVGTLGGPIWKDRTFFFGSVQLLRSAGAGGGLNTWLAPELVSWARIAYPTANGPKALTLAPPTRVFNGVPVLASTAFPHTATTGCETAATKNLPCSTPVRYVGQSSQTNPYDGTQWNVRLDQLLRGGKDRLYGQYIHLNQTTGFLSDRAYFDSATPSVTWYWSLNYVRVISSHLVNEAHFGAARTWLSTQPVNPVSQSVPVTPRINTGSSIQTTQSTTSGRDHSLNARDTVSWSHGAHSLRFGYQFFHGDSYSRQDRYARPFSTQFTDELTFLQDRATNASYFSIGGDGSYQPQVYGSKVSWNGIFVEDQWKVRPSLTLNVGLRYDDFGNPSKTENDALDFYPLFLGSGNDLLTQVLNVSTHRGDNAFVSRRKGNFQPRGGFALTPTADKKLLLRGGVGFYLDSVQPGEVSVNLPTNPPNRISLNVSTSSAPQYQVFLNPIPYGDFQTSAPPYGIHLPTVTTYGVDAKGNVCADPTCATKFASGLNGYDRDLKSQKVLVYSLGLEQEMGARSVFSITYVGSRAYDLYYSGDYNLLPGDLIVNGFQKRRTQDWGQITYYRNGLTSNYSGVIFATRQTYKSLFWKASYTWSHALQDAPNAGQSNSSTAQLFANVINPKQYYGNTSFDRTNVFSLSGGYTVPTVSHNRLLDLAASGWRIGTIITAESGTPFTVVNTTAFGPPTVANPLGGGYMADGNNFGIPTYKGQRHGAFSRDEARNGAFAISDFSAPTNYTTTPGMGNQGANIFRNTAYFAVDANVAKGFKIPWFGNEKATFTLRGEASNLLNRANLGPIGNLTNNSFFGKSSTSFNPRFLQLGARFDF